MTNVIAPRRSHPMRSSLSFALLLLSVPAQAGAANPVLTARDLAGMDLCQLDALFASATAEALPVGSGRGTILMRTDGKRLKMRLDGLVWKGKVFRDDGSYVNQWAGFRAIGTCAVIEPSWADGKPCVVLDHPAGTPVFGNARDELRQIAPGVWLGRFY